MDRNEVFQKVAILCRDFAGYRKGQAVFDIVWAAFPEVVDPLSGTDVDCYYEDGKIDAFLSACGIY